MCSLFTLADLKTVFGTDYTAGVLDEVGQCTWAGPDIGSTSHVHVIAAITPSTLDTIKSTFPGGVDLTVSGKAAYWNGAEGLQSLWVDLGGSRLLTLSLNPVDAGSQAIAQKLAEIALPKLL
jgi:hypothetical protein